MTRRLFLSLLVALLAAACGDDSAGPDENNITGTYTLRTVDGDNLPATIVQFPGYRLEVTAGRVTLNSDATFSDVTDFRETEGTTVTTSTETFVGTYTRAGNNVTFTTAEGDMYTMALSGTTLTQNFDGIILVYRK